MKETVYFVVGTVRSGSSMFHLMLGHHPQIKNPGEFDFLFDMVGDDGSKPNAQAYKDFLSINRIFLSKNLKTDGCSSHEEMIESFINQMSDDDVRLSMNIHRNFHRIPHCFPNAKYIHLVRDPRDVARSAIGMGWVGHVYHGVDIWKSVEETWDRLKPSLTPDQYIEITYEQLLADQEGVLSQVCEFMGVEYSDQMLNYADSSTYSKPDISLAYQWKRKQSEREVQLVESKVRPMIVDRGYELSDYPEISPGSLEKLKLLLLTKKHTISINIQRYGLPWYVSSKLAILFGATAWRNKLQVQKNAVDVELLK